MFEQNKILCELSEMKFYWELSPEDRIILYSVDFQQFKKSYSNYHFFDFSQKKPTLFRIGFLKCTCV